MMKRPHILGTTSMVMVLVVLAVGCGDGDDTATTSKGQTVPPVTTATTTLSATTTLLPLTNEGSDSARESVLIFFDAFEDDTNGWGGPFQRFDAGDYIWDLPAGQSDSRSPDTLIAVEDDIEAVEVTTSLVAERIDAVGVECAYEELDGSSRWYRLLIGVDGAEITKQPPGMVTAMTLASNTDARLVDGETQLRVLCRPGPDGYQLELYVDGDLAVEAIDADAPFGRAGSPNLYAQAAPSGADITHRVRFQDITIADPETNG